MSHEAKPLNPAIKIGIVCGFFVAWLALCFALNAASPFFREGGWGMWPILGAAMIFLSITVERTHYLFLKVKARQEGFIARVRQNLLQGDVSTAVQTCDQNGGPLARIVGAGLRQLGGADEEVQEAVDEAALYELPRIEKRTGYLAMIGNIATLLGLLGTIVGLITSFAGVSLEQENDPATQRRALEYVSIVPACKNMEGPELVLCIKNEKQTILSQGISEAMHCTAFGLGVGILSLIAFSILSGRTQNLVDGLSKSVVQLVNFGVSHRKVMKL